MTLSNRELVNAFVPSDAANLGKSGNDILGSMESQLGL